MNKKSPRRRCSAFPYSASLCVSSLVLLCAGASTRVPAQSVPTLAGACAVNKAQGVKVETPPPDAAGGIKLVVTGGDGKPLQRKRFFLLEKNLEQAGGLNWAAAPRRENYLKGASPQLLAWLKAHDCDTLYCPEYEAEFEGAVATVPEFKKAYEEGLRKYRSPKLALSWITVNFPLKEARTEFYKRKKAWLEDAARKSGRVMSVMTDEKGVAYFTGLKLRDYYVSNLIPLEDGNVLWNCAVSVPAPIPRQMYSVLVELSYPKRPDAATK
ncbi:MAG TPA: hypothetical protein VM934_04820 [Pyrinomonadaceae bacterium]|jgi:hypothetical protein|nr:hypothetical protein [Pyrinomonadaceae bacterium]